MYPKTVSMRIWLAAGPLLALALGCATLEARGPAAADDRVEIFLLHDNDLHWDFNHREAFEEAVDWFRAEHDNVFLLNAGDLFVRHRNRWPVDSMEFYEARSRFIINTMNEIGYDAATLGNHELDYHGTATRDVLRTANFPLLGANVRIDTDNFDAPASYAVLETEEGPSIAVLGLCVHNGDAEGVAVVGVHETVAEYKHLGDAHDVFVALTHIGVNRDRELAETHGEFDVIIGGHSHTLLGTAETVNGVLVAQAGGHPHELTADLPKFLGVVRLVLDNGEIAEKTGRVYRFDAESSDIDRIAANYGGQRARRN